LRKIKIKITVILFFIISIASCASDQNSRNISNYSIPVSNFSQTVELLISNEEFLEEEILKINAQNPSVQRIILGADSNLKQERYVKANSELERAFRITKKDAALYLRLAHLRYKQGLLKESESFAYKGLLLTNLSSWERLLLNVYLKN
tara:strand:- start:1401 stop:1847 length:447 start_codon:yes stop_codon:yes gene_type:complete